MLNLVMGVILTVMVVFIYRGFSKKTVESVGRVRERIEEFFGLFSKDSDDGEEESTAYERAVKSKKKTSRVVEELENLEAPLVKKVFSNTSQETAALVTRVCQSKVLDEDIIREILVLLEEDEQKALEKLREEVDQLGLRDMLRPEPGE